MSISLGVEFGLQAVKPVAINIAAAAATIKNTFLIE